MMKKIGFFGDGPWSHRSLKRLIEREDITVCFVVPRSDVPDQELIKIAREAKIPVHEGLRVNKNKSLDLIKSYSCDLLISMSFNQIIKKPLIDLAPLGFINCHAGALPDYRGRNILNWALINDEKEFGITVHFIDEGIDTGDIISQEMFSINDEDDYGTLLEKAFEECPRLLDVAISKVIKEDFKPIKQDSIGPGFYCGMRQAGDEFINWNQSSRSLFNFIRAISAPGITARTFLGSEEVKVCESRDLPEYPQKIGIPGQVIGKDNSGIIVKASDRAILVKKLVDLKDKDLLSMIKIGDRFLTKDHNHLVNERGKS